MLDVRDGRGDRGAHGRRQVRFGRGSRGRGPKTRLVRAITSVAALLDWWMVAVRHQFGDDYARPDAPLLPSERRDPPTGVCQRIGDQALRDGLAGAARRWLPAWAGPPPPHTPPHFSAPARHS